MTRTTRTLLFALAILIGSTSTALAQTAPHLARLEIAIWPEYDQPAALVMLRAQLAPDMALPAIVPLPMPASIPAPNAVAKRAPDGGLLLAQHTVEQRGDWTIFNVEADFPEVRIEYYAPMDLSQPQREFVFEWPGGMTIDEVVFEIQQPLGAADMVVVPPPANRNPGADGMTYALGSLGAAAATDAKTIALTYTKSSPSLSIAGMQPTAPPPTQQIPSAGATPAATDRPPETGSSKWMVTLGIVLGVGILLVWFVISGKKD